MNAFRTRRRRAVLTFGIGLVAVALGATMGLFSGAKGDVASAQELSCRTDSIGVLCLRKDTGGQSGSFLFEIEIEESSLPTVAVPCLLPGSAVETEFNEVLGGGDEVAIYFGCAIRVTEVPQQGWQLVDIDCDFNNTFYDVRREGSSIVILLDQGSLDSQGNGNNSVECTFVNRRIDERPLNLGGLFAGQPTPLPTAPPPAAVAPAATSPVISPPRTGDAGLR
jgi:hypothetical protein